MQRPGCTSQYQVSNKQAQKKAFCAETIVYDGYGDGYDGDYDLHAFSKTFKTVN